jgi:hypothetical protein
MMKGVADQGTGFGAVTVDVDAGIIVSTSSQNFIVSGQYCPFPWLSKKAGSFDHLE